MSRSHSVNLFLTVQLIAEQLDEQLIIQIQRQQRIENLGLEC